MSHAGLLCSKMSQDSDNFVFLPTPHFSCFFLRQHYAGGIYRLFFTCLLGKLGQGNHMINMTSSFSKQYIPNLGLPMAKLAKFDNTT